jgi:hypothetical protein
VTGEEVVKRRPPTATAVVVRSAGVAQPVWYFGISPAALPLTAVTALATLASSIPRAATIVAVVTVSTAAAAAAAVSTCRERIIVGDSRAIKQAKCTAYVHASAQRGRCFRMRTVAALATSVRVATTATSPVRCGVRAERRQDSYTRLACARRAPVAALGDKPGGRTDFGVGKGLMRTGVRVRSRYPVATLIRAFPGSCPRGAVLGWDYPPQSHSCPSHQTRDPPMSLTPTVGRRQLVGSVVWGMGHAQRLVRG